MAESGPLPLILAGPILRRVEETRVCVWIATSQRVRVTGYIFDINATKQLGQGQCETLAFGEALHIAVVEITPLAKAPPFETGKLLAYDLQLERLDKDGKTQAKDLLSNISSSGGNNSLAYPPYSYPTFLIGTGTLNILHGSCRKAHGAGDDALATADLLLAATASNPTERPGALFLTGDQIYADDVHDELITPASQLGRRLLGFDEKIPAFQVPVHRLNSLVRRPLAAVIFSPDENAKNQLLGFGDFVGVYLLSFNDSLWAGRLSPKSKELKSFLKTLPLVRRALANIPTYMIFDDHELTDDWNITKAWEIRALEGREGPTGRRVIANALCAYWAFQGWGNKPEAFDDTFRKTITDYFANCGSDATAFEATLLETHPWAFVAPTSPPAFFLDSRTRRAPSAVRNDAPSALLDDSALEDFKAETSKQKGDGKWDGNWLVVIAQTPVFGNPDSERYLEDKGWKDESDVEEYDLEVWHANRSGYYKLIQTIVGIAPRGCIILSGDVHYGFVAQVSVIVKGTRFSFTQFTSSALKNSATGKSRFGLSVIRNSADSIDEQGWINKPKYTQPRVSKRVSEILAVSPTVLTDAEVIEAGAVGKSDIKIANQPIRPTTPRDGFFLHEQTNLGQLLLTEDGQATLRFYKAGSNDPFAEYKLQLGKQVVTKTQTKEKPAPQLETIATINGIDVQRIKGEKPFFFLAPMSVSADGAPHGYNEDDTKALDNAVNQKYDVPDILGNKTKQPDGFYVNPTALADSGIADETNQSRYVDATTIPYIALPPNSALVGSSFEKASKGDFAIAYNTKNGEIAHAIFADIGPARKIGLASIRTAEVLDTYRSGEPHDARRGGAKDASIIYVVFPNTHKIPAWPLTESQVVEAAKKAFESWGGSEKLKTLYPDI